MQLGYIGLGKMGQNMVNRLILNGWDVVATDTAPEAVKTIAAKGATPAFSLKELTTKTKLQTQRLIWIMVPWKAVESVLQELVPLLSSGDTVIDGGNSPFKESIRRGQELAAKGINFLDAGVSGGPAGARDGSCVMIGGEENVFKKHEALFRAIAAPDSYGYMGKAGAGHFVKMVHNGIEYGMMWAIAEGADIIREMQSRRLVTANIADVFRVYQHGSVIQSRLVGWTESAFRDWTDRLEGISGEVDATGEGLWTVETAQELGIPAEVIEKSLELRARSKAGSPEERAKISFQGQVNSALRNKFGGHDVKSKK